MGARRRIRVDRGRQLLKAGECFGRQRASDHVTTDDDSVDSGLCDLGKHSFQCWQIAMGVVEYGNTHPISLAQERHWSSVGPEARPLKRESGITA